MYLGSCVEALERWPARERGSESMFTSTAATHQPMALDLFLLSTRLAAQSCRQSQGDADWRLLPLSLFGRSSRTATENKTGADNGEYGSEHGRPDSCRQGLIRRHSGRRSGEKPHAQKGSPKTLRNTAPSLDGLVTSHFRLELRPAGFGIQLGIGKVNCGASSQDPRNGLLGWWNSRSGHCPRRGIIGAWANAILGQPLNV